MPSEKPNILFFHVDNLGMGELGCYGGGILRGADTKRMDKFAKRGRQADALRRRAAVHADPLGADDRTLPDPLGQPHHRARRQRRRHRAMGAHHRPILSEAGYATSIYGKWHIGAEDGRLPTDHGFDEWYGPLRTYDECMWLEDPHYVPERDGFSHMHEGRQGQGRKADPRRSSSPWKSRRPATSNTRSARSSSWSAVRQGGQAVLLLLQSLADALPDDAARRIRRQEHQRRMGRLPVDARPRLRRAARQARRARRRRQHHRRDVRRQRRRGSPRRPRHRRLLRRLVLQLGGRRHPHAVPDPLAGPHQAGHREQRDGSRHRHVHDAAAIGRLRAAARSADRRRRPERRSSSASRKPRTASPASSGSRTNCTR